MPTKNIKHIKYYNTEKVYGFLRPESGEPDMFSYSLAVDASESQTLGESQYVSYDLVQGDRGSQADHIKVIF